MATTKGEGEREDGMGLISNPPLVSDRGRQRSLIDSIEGGRNFVQICMFVQFNLWHLLFNPRSAPLAIQFNQQRQLGFIGASGIGVAIDIWIFSAEAAYT